MTGYDRSGECTLPGEGQPGEYIQIMNRTPYLSGGKKRLYTQEELYEMFGTERFIEETSRLVEGGVMKEVEHYVATGVLSGKFNFFWTREGVDLLWGECFVKADEQRRLHNLYFYVHDSVGEKPMMRWMRLSASHLLPEDTVVPGQKSKPYGEAVVNSFFSSWWTHPNRRPKEHYYLVLHLLETMTLKLMSGEAVLAPYGHENDPKSFVMLRERRDPKDYDLPKRVWELFDRIRKMEKEKR